MLHSRSFCFLFPVFAAASAFGATVTVVSGNGTIGSADSQVHFLLGPATDDFAPLTGTDFSNAEGGSFAQIIPANVFWGTLVTGAQWVGDNSSASSTSGNTDLYAISFNLPGSFTSASFSIDYEVDNLLGGTNNAALFLNGTPLGLAGGSGGFGLLHSYSQSGVESMLHAGTNWFFLDAVNQGGPAGLLFAATITTADAGAVTPEPGTLSLIAIGGLGMLAGFRRRSR